ncbi:hypothetical protein AgCh_024069 [Apium graveolens]
MSSIHFTWKDTNNDAEYEALISGLELALEMKIANLIVRSDSMLGKVAGVLEVDIVTAITAQLKALSLKIDSLANYGVNQITRVCELCAGSHATEQCAISSESAQFVSNFQRSQQPVPDTYHLDNWNHPKFRWSNNQNAMQQPFQQFGEKQFNPPGKVSSDTEVPGKREAEELVKVITLRSEKVASPEKSQVPESEVLAEVDVQKEAEEHTPSEGNTGEKQVYPPPPFLKRLQNQKLDKQFAKFLEVFKKLHINIPFTETLEQMSNYVRFMKGILSRKVKLDDLETIALMEECSVVLQQKLPPMLKYPGSFTIPCTIGKFSFDKCLCDLGASINLMPLSIFKKLIFPNPKPTYVSLELADHSIAYPRVIVEDVLVKVDKLIFPADFVILDFEEDKKIPIILRRPFLATGRTMIDVQKGELTMKGLGYIFDDDEGGRTDPPVPTKGFSHVQQEVDRTGVGDVQYRTLIRCIEAMHDIHRHCAEDLTHALDWPPNPPPEKGDPPDN